MDIGAMKAIETELAVASTSTVYSLSFDIGFALYFGLWVQATAPSGTPDIKIELEESKVVPATQRASDGNWIVPDGMSAISAGITDELVHIFTISPKPMPYARFKLTGQNANPAGAVITLTVFVQEPS